MTTKLATPDLSNDAWLQLAEQAERATEDAHGDWDALQRALKDCVATAAATGLAMEQAQSFAEKFALTVALDWDLSLEVVRPALAAVCKFDLPEMVPFRLAAELSDWARRTHLDSRDLSDFYRSVKKRLSQLDVRTRIEAEQLLMRSPWPTEP